MSLQLSSSINPNYYTKFPEARGLEVGIVTPRVQSSRLIFDLDNIDRLMLHLLLDSKSPGVFLGADFAVAALYT